MDRPDVNPFVVARSVQSGATAGSFGTFDFNFSAPGAPVQGSLCSFPTAHLSGSAVDVKSSTDHVDHVDQ